MKLILATIVFFLSQIVQAEENQAAAGCLDCFNFAAPLVNDVSTVSPAQVGQIAYDTSDNQFKGHKSDGSWVQLGQQVAVLLDQRLGGVNGGASVAGWQTRQLQTVQASADFVSLSGDQFTLQPGTYFIQASAPAYNCGRHHIRLRNVTDNADVVVGSAEHPHNGSAVQSRSQLVGVTQISVAKTFEIQHWTQFAVANTGLGVNTTSGEQVTFTQVVIQKIN